MKTVITDYNFYNDRADEVMFDTDDIRTIISELKSTMNTCMYDCLCAPQIGFMKRIICVRFKDEIRTYINPCIVDAKGTMGFNIETCVSVPNERFALLRYPEVHISYFEEDGRMHSSPVAFIGMSAMYIQQMIDILDGRLICDESLPILEGWEKLSSKEQDEIFKFWLEKQNSTLSQVKQEIENNPELKQLSDGIDFLNSVREGKTKLEQV